MLALDSVLESAGIEALLTAHTDFLASVLSAAHTDPVEWICRARPQVTVLADQRNGSSALPLVAALRGQLPRSATVVLAHSEAGTAAGAFLAAGAAAYVMQGTRADDLITALRAVAEGQHEWGPAVVRGPSGQCRQTCDWTAGGRGLDHAAALTPRERQIIALIASSLTTRGIADRLALSPATIATHRSNLMRKLGVRNAAELTRFAWSAGVLQGQREPV